MTHGHQVPLDIMYWEGYIITSVIFLPKKNYNLNNENTKQTQIEEHPQNNWPVVLFERVSDEERLRNCHRSEETK